MEKLLLLFGTLACMTASVAFGGATDFGTTGLIKMPSARMEEDGVLRATISLDEVANIYNVTFQALPKVQGSFRYAIFNPGEKVGSVDQLRDRSYEIKALIVEEAGALPAVAIGAKDILGTGAWEGEYLVASKSWRRLDATIGLGWGRLGTRSSFSNPLGVVSDRFDERPAQRETGGNFAGKSRSSSFFRGDAAIFGGFSYRLKTLPLTLIAEYESDKYDREVRFGTIKNPSAWNAGVAWEPWTGISLRASWLRGDALGFTFSSQLNTKSVGAKKSPSRSVRADLNPRTGLPSGYDAQSWYDRILFGAEQSGLLLKKGGLKKGGREASLVIENLDYNLTADAIGHFAFLSESFLPKRVERVDFLLEEGGLKGPTVVYELQRQSQEDGAFRGQRASKSVKLLAPREIINPSNTTDYRFPSLAIGLDLAARVQLMDPEDPARKQVYAKVTSRLQLSNHWNVWMSYEQDLYNDFSTARASNSTLQRVRTDINRYLVDGKSGLEQLYLERKKSLSAVLHSRFYAGILESMYGGVGAEMLYSPFNQRWAVGLNANLVKQRGFERDFEFRNYETVTSHISAYYAAPIYDIDLALHVGQYLAKDRGYTVEARRTFDNGFSLGGFFTRTNVSAFDYGEGSFDKGLYFRIPFDGFLPGNTRASYSTILRPLERDGGRRLENFGGNLWFDRRSLRYDALDRNRARMLPQ